MSSESKRILPFISYKGSNGNRNKQKDKTGNLIEILKKKLKFFKTPMDFLERKKSVKHIPLRRRLLFSGLV